MSDHMDPNLLSTVLTSTVISGVVGAAVSGALGLWAKHTDFKNDYFKIVISRRVSAYEKVERLIFNLKMSVVDDEKRPYHLVFTGDPSDLLLQKILMEIQSEALWISDEVFATSRKFNLLLFSLPNEEQNLIEFGKSNYEQIANIRSALEKLLARDMLSLYDASKFLKQKRDSKSEFVPTRLGSVA